MILISCIARAELLGSTRLGDRLWPVRCDERCILYPFFDVVACLLCDVASKALLTWFRVQSESKGLDMWGLNSCHTLLYVRQSITHFCMLTSGFWVGMQQCTKYRQTSLHYNNQCCRVWMLPHCYEPPPPGDTEDWELQCVSTPNSGSLCFSLLYSTVFVILFKYPWYGIVMEAFSTLALLRGA